MNARARVSRDHFSCRHFSSPARDQCQPRAEFASESSGKERAVSFLFSLASLDVVSKGTNKIIRWNRSPYSGDSFAILKARCNSFSWITSNEKYIVSLPQIILFPMLTLRINVDVDARFRIDVYRSCEELENVFKLYFYISI